MRIPVKWLKNYVKTNKSAAELAKSFTSLGLMLEKPIKNEILELEHRFDRADWLSILGCARDLAAFESVDFVKPELKKQKVASGGNVDIKVSDKNLVNRFTTRVFKNIKVGKSPDWLSESLESYGIASINSVVDITNYVMVEMGQPLHAQDLSKFQKREIEIRLAKKGESIKTLLGTEIELDEDVAILCQNNTPAVIMGIVGGHQTSVDESTKEIVLDAGNYNQSLVRKTARKLKIQNETVLRCDKYLHPKQTMDAIQRATDLILELCGGEVYENGDYYPVEAKPKHMALSYARVLKVSGMEFEPKRIKDILTRLEYKIVKETSEYLELEIPYFRTDIEVEDDMVADILRINSYENIPLAVIEAAPPKNVTSDIYKLEDELRDILVKLGLHEHITDPLVQSENEVNEILLENSLSSEKNALRTNITRTLKPVVEIYMKNNFFQNSTVKLFEIGKSFEKDTTELRQLEVVISSSNGHKETSREVNLTLINLIKELGIKRTYIKSNGEIMVGKTKIGHVRYDGFTLDVVLLLQLRSKNVVSRALDVTSAVQTEDISLVMDKSIKAGEILEKIYSTFQTVDIAYVVSEFSKSDIQKSVTFRLEFDSNISKEEILNIKHKLTNN